MARPAAKLATSVPDSGGFSWELPSLTVDVRQEVLQQLAADYEARSHLAWGFLLGSVNLESPIGRHFVIDDCIELDGIPGKFEPHQRMIVQTFGGAGSFPAVGIYVRAESNESATVADLMLAVIGHLRTPLATVILLRPDSDGRLRADLNLRVAGEPLQKIRKVAIALPERTGAGRGPAPQMVRAPQTAEVSGQREAGRSAARRWRPSGTLLGGAAVVLAAAGGVFGWKLLPGGKQPAVDGWQPPAQFGVEALSRNLDVFASRKGRDLEVTWNAAAPVLRGAGRGSLFITDGQQRTQVLLEASHLQSGRVLYVPRTNDIDVRLDIVTAGGQTVRESLRVLGAGRASGDVAGPAGPEQRAPAPAVTAPDESINAAAAKEPPRTFTPPPAPAFAVGTARIERLPELGVATTTGPAPLPASVLLRTVPAPRDEQPAAPVGPRTAPAVRDEPVAGTTPNARPTFVPAAPVQKVPVSVPSTVRAMMTAEVTVEVKVRVDERGRVTKSEPVYVSSPLHTHLAGLARNSAWMWRFTPARLGDRAVASDYLIVFKFRK